MKMIDIPDFAKKYKKKGYDVRLVRGTYQLFKISSKRVEGKSYPVLSQEYIGTIKEDGSLFVKDNKQYYEFGLSNVIYKNFNRTLVRSVFNGGDYTNKIIKLGIIYFIYGFLDKRLLALSVYTKDDIELIELMDKIKLNRIINIADKIDALFKEKIDDDNDRLYIIQALKQIQSIDINKGNKYPSDLCTLLNKYSLKYE